MLTTPKALLISTLVAGTVAVAPAAYINYDNQEAQHAYTTEGAVAKAAQRVADRAQAQQTVEAVEDAVDVPEPATQEMAAPPVRQSIQQRKATISDAPVTVCSGWRRLEDGQTARPMVRMCEGAVDSNSMHDDPANAPPSALKEKEQSQRYAPRPSETYEYTFDIGAP